MEKETLLDYIMQQGCAEIPSIQRHFKLSYAEARKAVNELVEDKYLVFDSGVKYAIAFEKKEEENPFADLKPFEVDVDEFEHLDGLDKVDPCIKVWIAEKVKANADITLNAALSLVKTEQKEASSVNDNKRMKTLRKVAYYLDGLDAFMFYLAKKHATE